MVEGRRGMELEWDRQDRCRGRTQRSSDSLWVLLWRARADSLPEAEEEAGGDDPLRISSISRSQLFDFSLR